MTHASSNGIDPFETPGRNEPSARVAGNPFLRPPLQGGTKRLVHRILSRVEVAEHADQGRKNATTILSKEAVDGLAYRFSRRLGDALILPEPPQFSCLEWSPYRSLAPRA